MNIIKVSVIVSLLTSVQFTVADTKDLTSLPSIQLMADAELRDEVLTAVLPFQEDEKVREALQHQLVKKEQDIQNSNLAQNMPSLHIQPQANLPDMSQMSLLQREYVLSVAAGLQSPDPSSGIFKMLEPLGIDRDRALSGVGNGTLQINLDTQRLNQLFGDRLHGEFKAN